MPDREYMRTIEVQGTVIGMQIGRIQQNAIHVGIAECLAVGVRHDKSYTLRHSLVPVHLKRVVVAGQAVIEAEHAAELTCTRCCQRRTASSQVGERQPGNASSWDGGVELLNAWQVAVHIPDVSYRQHGTVEEIPLHLQAVGLYVRRRSVTCNDRDGQASGRVAVCDCG